LPAREDRHPRAKLRIVLQVESDLTRTIAAESRQAVLNICRVADLRGFAVADNIDADLDLPANDAGYPLRHHAIKLGAIIRLVFFALKKQVNDSLASGQTPDVRS